MDQPERVGDPFMVRVTSTVLQLGSGVGEGLTRPFRTSNRFRLFFLLLSPHLHHLVSLFPLLPRCRGDRGDRGRLTAGSANRSPRWAAEPRAHWLVSGELEFINVCVCESNRVMDDLSSGGGEEGWRNDKHNLSFPLDVSLPLTLSLSLSLSLADSLAPLAPHIARRL